MRRPWALAPVATATKYIKSMCVDEVTLGHLPTLLEALRPYGTTLLRLVAEKGTRIQALAPGVSYCDASTYVASHAPGLDGWPRPPSGLFVVSERTVYIRESKTMLIAHEFGHAVDAALARNKNSYYSYESDEFRLSFAKAFAFVNDYAASGLDEFFAESLRALVEVNSPEHTGNAWVVSREQLKFGAPMAHSLLLAIGKGKLQ